MRQGRLSRKRIATIVAGALAAGAMLAGPAHAQLSTSTVRGTIAVGTAPVKAGATVVARNVDTGVTTRTVTREDGSYVLAGLAPGNYSIEVSAPGLKQTTQVITVRVGETASLDLALASGTEQVGKILVVGAAQRLDVRTPEVGTNVSRAQIENLPQVTRNFLGFADLAPGVNFNIDTNSGMVRLQSGAQNQDNVNLFIDGVGQKNYILRGGVAGMDATRGNPFPQSAVAEYKVITQNYKAEFDQVSSAAITAVTKTGTNDLHGSVFWDHTSTNWTAKDPFQERAASQGVQRPKATQDQYGFDLGGAIQKDTLHYYMAYEGKDIATPRSVVLQNDNLLPNAGIVPGLRSLQGSKNSTFKENLFFGRIDAQINRDQRLTLSGRIRREEDLIPENMTLSAPGNDKNRTNDENRIDLKHEWNLDTMLNEARIGYEDYKWNPHSNSSDPMIRFFVSPSNESNNTRPVIFIGGSPDAQKRMQSGTYVQDDLTFTGVGGHTVKGGVKVKDMTFDLSGTSRSVDIAEQLINNTTGLATTFNFFPAIAPAGVKFKDRQLGLYVQDDWQVNRRLELNYGLRWDYEDNALNNNYATPADRVAALYGPDSPRYGITPPAGQTYAQSLARGGVSIGDFISDGSSRKAFNGAFQPRAGFSYDLAGNLDAVLFGGAGRAYDRTMANHALDEMQKNAQPNGEIWLIKNDHKMPYTDQFTLGLRKALWIWNTEIGYMDSRSHNQFIWYGGNRDANGGYATQSPIDPLWGGPSGFGTLILGDFVAQAKTQSVYLRADKPYTRVSGWGLSATYTHSDAKTTNREWTNDIFSWTYGKPGESGKWYKSKDVSPDKLVVAGFTDKLIPWGVTLSGKATVASARPYRITDCSAGWSNCVFREGKGDKFQELDLGLAKSVRLPFGAVIVRLDVLNVLNTVNYDGHDDWGGGPGNAQNYLGGDNPNLGTPTSMAGPMRTFKLGVRYMF